MGTAALYNVTFSLPVFKIFSLSLVQISLTMIFLGMAFFVYILLGFTEIPESGNVYPSPNLRYFQPLCLFCLNKFIYFIYLFLAALGLRCCMPAFSSCSKGELLFIVVRGLLIAMTSLIVEHGL